MVIDCYYIYVMHSINMKQQILIFASLLIVNIKILLFDKILLNFKTLNCWYGQTIHPIFMKFTHIIEEGI